MHLISRRSVKPRLRQARPHPQFQAHPDPEAMKRVAYARLILAAIKADPVLTQRWDEVWHASEDERLAFLREVAVARGLNWT